MLKFELGNVPYYYLGSNQQQLLIQTKKTEETYKMSCQFFFANQPKLDDVQ
jgi:hypothetical protein